MNFSRLFLIPINVILLLSLSSDRGNIATDIHPTAFYYSISYKVYRHITLKYQTFLNKYFLAEM